jgi:hypothetical protein
MTGTVVTVELTSGGTLTGVVVEEHDDHIVLDVGCGGQTVYRRRIASIKQEQPPRPAGVASNHRSRGRRLPRR